MIKVGIVGGTGYTGVELLRILASHPNVSLETITSRQEAGLPVGEMFPNLRKKIDLNFSNPYEAELKKCDLVFFATPNGVAMHEVKPLMDQGIRIIDLSADFRIKDVVEWEKWYGMKHASPEIIAKAVYGLPEFNRDKIRSAQLIANPGCYPTAVQLGLMPLLKEKVIYSNELIADAKSGVSGAGRKSETKLLFAELADNFKAYNVAGHRHLPEIKQGLKQMAGQDVNLTFVPHLIPMIRGIYVTLYARMNQQIDAQELFERYYANELFIDVMSKGVYPETRSVRASNVCRIAIHQASEEPKLIVLVAIDNLVKGAAGQAIQNMNLMFDFPENMGLDQSAVLP